MPVFRHATTRVAWHLLQQHGLDPSWSQGKEQVLWLHTPGFTTWAVAHTIDRHLVPVEEVVVLEVRIARRRLTRFRRGMWKCRTLIAASACTLCGSGSDFY